MATDYRTLAALAKITNSIIDLRRAFSDTSVDDPVKLVVTHLPITEQGAVTAMQLHDTEQFDIVIDAVDSKGFQVPDAFDVVSSDVTVVTVVSHPDARTYTLVAGAPGSAVVTISDGLLSATEAIDVIAGNIAKISIVEGAVSEQPAPVVDPPADVPPADVPPADAPPADPVA